MRPVAQIAQSVEQGIENPRVGGSIPSLGTTIKFQVVQLSSEAHKKPAQCGLFVVFVLLARTGATHRRPSTQYPPRAVYLSKNTNNGLSFSRPLNIGARCSTGVPFNCSVSLRATITQDGRGSASN